MPFHPAAADDPRLADYQSVSDPDRARSSGVFVAEGRLVVARVLEDDRWRIRSILVNEAARRELGEPLARAAERVPVFLCDTGDFQQITGYDIHRGCLALVERPAERRVSDLLAQSRTVIVLEGVANPDNMGGVFRNAAAFGVDAVLLGPGCSDPLYRKAVRTSMAATLRVPFGRTSLTLHWLDEIRAAQFALVAMTPRLVAEPLEAFTSRPLPPRLAFIVGAEGPGLSRELEAAADYRVAIPLEPGVDSLNLAVATGIVLHQLRLARRSPAG